MTSNRFLFDVVGQHSQHESSNMDDSKSQYDSIERNDETGVRVFPSEPAVDGRPRHWYIRNRVRNNTLRLSCNSDTKVHYLSIARLSSLAAVLLLLYSNAWNFTIATGASSFVFAMMQSMHNSLSQLKHRQQAIRMESQQLRIESLLTRNRYHSSADEASKLQRDPYTYLHDLKLNKRTKKRLP